MKINNIAKNTSYFTFALILQKIISFAYFVILAKALLPEDLGKYYFAISFTAIFAIFIDLGLANVLTREVAKKKSQAEALLGSVLAIKISLAVFSLLSVFLLINIMGNYSELARQLVYFSSVCMVLDSFTLTFFSVMRGFHNLIFESFASVAFQLIVLAFGFWALKLGLGLKWLMAALILASSFNFIYAALLTRMKWKIKLWPRPDFALIKIIARIAAPFAIFAVLQRLYVYLDSVLLSILAGDKYVGLYQIAFKIIFALQFLPMAFTASLYPAFASYWAAKNKEQLAVTFERAMNYLIIISLPISAGIIVLADKIILFFKPEYLEAVWPLRIVMISLLFIFLNFPIGSLLNACDRQKINTLNMAITLGASAILNLILIPFYNVVGAAITVSATSALMFALGIFQVPRITKIRFKKIITVFLKTMLAVIIMGAAALYLKAYFNIFIVIIISGLIYTTLLYLLGGFRKEDVISIWRSFYKTQND